MSMTEEQKARVIANCEIIAKALREGKPLQWRLYGIDEKWKECLALASNHFQYEYRIKPEPRTIWVNSYANDSRRFYGHETREQAIKKGTLICGGGHPEGSRIAVEYREVVK